MFMCTYTYVCMNVCVGGVTILSYIKFISPNLKRKHKTTCFSHVVITVEFNISEYNVSESQVTVLLQLEANDTSEFDYVVTLKLSDISTGEY